MSIHRSVVALPARLDSFCLQDEVKSGVDRQAYDLAAALEMRQGPGAGVGGVYRQAAFAAVGRGLGFSVSMTL